MLQIQRLQKEYLRNLLVPEFIILMDTHKPVTLSQIILITYSVRDVYFCRSNRLTDVQYVKVEFWRQKILLLVAISVCLDLQKD